MLRVILLISILFSALYPARAIVIRHDTDHRKYSISPAEFPALADMTGEGHGVLIAPEWVVTVAHAVPRAAQLKHIQIGGVSRAVEHVVLHPGYQLPSQQLVDQAVSSGDWILAVLSIASSDDIAMIKLKQPITDIAPVTLHKGGDELGQIVKIIGKGATGTGLTGHAVQGPNRTELRRAFNTVTSANERWFCYIFDDPAAALPLEGKTGGGDSGGPALIEVDGQWTLSGLAAWGFIHGDVRTTPPGLYGQLTCNVRLSRYTGWIEGVMAGRSDKGRETT